MIKELHANGCNVIVAAEKAIKSLLEAEFQHLTFIPLHGYRISYSRQRFWMPFKILSQVPKILHNIYKEHQWLKKVVKKYTINAVIADNRFGLFHPGIRSVYITHQLLIKTGNRFS
ncbi:MAG: glycosyl transferase family 28, partial [Ferruginibacter sp.]